VRLGPVQLLVVAFDRPDRGGDVLVELDRLRESDVVRVIDVLVVHKGSDGVVQRSEGSAGGAGGAMVGALIGLDATRYEPDGGEDELWSLDEAIPNDSAAAIALIEHRWAIGTRDAIHAAGGLAVADAWVHPADLVAAGLIDAEDAAEPTA
jgi:hypothetical protein